MAVVANPYTQHHAKLGVLEEGLKTLKNERVLMSNSKFSDMYWAVERHHRDLRLAHLTGKAKDLMEQADKDTKFYNILIKMLCEVKKSPSKQRKHTLRKVHNWYVGNRHILATGPRFGKSTPRSEEELEKGIIRLKSGKTSNRSTKSGSSFKNYRSNKENQGKEKDQESRVISETKDDVSSMHDVGESINPPSERAFSRLSLFGNDFLTNRFMMDLPSSKLSWHIDTPQGKSRNENSSPTDWDGPDIELQRIGESSLSRPTFDENLNISHPSVPHSSPRSHLGNESPQRVGSAGSRGRIDSARSEANASSDVDVGSADMMDFQSDVKRGLSHGQHTSTGFYTNGGVHGMSDQSSGAGYGLPKKMVHSIASLVNPHAKLAESEAKRQEREYYQDQRTTTPFRPSSRMSSNKGPPDLSAHIPVLRTVNVSSNKGDNLNAFNSFRHDHLYGQDILSKLNFVGRSGTALDVRYTAHGQGDQPEKHTKDVIQLYSLLTSNGLEPQAKQTESMIHHQTLEEFYQSSEQFSPALRPFSRIQSAPAPRVMSTKSRKINITRSAKTAVPKDQLSSPAKTPSTQKLGKSLLDEKQEKHDTEEDEVLYSVDKPATEVRLETVVTMIDQVKDEMNYFREKLAPTPMPGFRQPASTAVSSKPLSRPTSTTSHRSRPKSSQFRPRSPSPQGRPGTPQEEEEILMGEPEVSTDTFKSTIPNRPHSATVSKAVDWRGKVTPELAKIRSKNRFGGHSYVQKLKPSLRTAGAVSAGKRPKTAPISMKERWHTKEKEEKASSAPIKLPDVQTQECDKNSRVSAQAASNTMTQVDDQDMDRIMNIQHLLGTSDSRYGSMGSLFLDEEFLRSMNSRYATASSMSHLTSGSQNKEYLSFVAPKTPRQTPADGQSTSRQGGRKPDVTEIQDVLTEREEELAQVEDSSVVPPLQLDQLLDQENQADQSLPEVKVPVIQSTVDSSQTFQEHPTQGLVGEEKSEVKVNVGDDLETHNVNEVKVTEVLKPPDEITRDIVHVESEHREDGTRIEVTAVPAIGRPATSPTESTLKVLSESETWHFQHCEDPQNIQESLNENARFEVKDLEQDEKHLRHQHHYAHHRLDIESRQGNWAKLIVKPENYCFQGLPENMSTKVGRSAGRMPGGIQSPAGQVLRMSRRQNEHFKKSPLVRTPPSIPSTHHMHSASSPRQGQQYSTELEHHARKVKSPRHFMEHDSPRKSRPVVELRKENCKSAPPGSRQDTEDFMDSLSIVSLRTSSRAQTAPTLHTQRTSDTLGSLPAHPEHPEEDGSTDTGTPEVIYARPPVVSVQTKLRPTTQAQSLANIGRPIPQVSHVPDPDEVLEAVTKQKEAKAAVDIQRIFRGYVCRNSYRKLIWENRKAMEDKQMALQESQREYKKHIDRKTKIYNRPPLDPHLLQWAKDFKEIQIQQEGKRQVKVDAMAQEMLANQQKAKSKIETIGPHVEIYDIYHPNKTGPSKRDMHKASVCIQKYARGFLVRRRFEKLRRKATFCGSTWEKLVKDYKNLLIRVQRWHGVDKPTTPFTLQDMHEYMDLRRRYESQFDKKAFGSEIELSELESFFRECDLFPSKAEIDEGLDVTTQGQALKKGNGLKKHEALNLVFYIYVPKATGLTNTRQSTWMNPIINGVEARKLIGNEFVENAPLKPCIELVTKSRKERKMKEDEEKERQEALERKAKHGQNDSNSDSDENLGETSSTVIVKAEGKVIAKGKLKKIKK